MALPIRDNLSSKGSHAAGFFELQLDKAKTTAYLKSVEGGFIRATPVEEPMGPDQLYIKHISTVEIEPLSLELGMSGSRAILDWIQQSWKRKFMRHNGQITHANFNLDQTFVHEFSDALIKEVTFPTMDGSSKEPAYLKLKIQPESVKTTKAAGPKIQSPIGPNQKQWLCSAFHLHLDGFEESLDYTNKVDGFTITQNMKPLYVGGQRLPQYEPTNIKFPNITGTVSLAYADKLIKWFEDYVVQGKQDGGAQTNGALDFLSPDRQKVLFSVVLNGVGIHHLEIPQSTANAEQIKRVKFELYVTEMDLQPGAGMD